MDKNKVLEKSRKENNMEYEEKIYEKASKYGIFLIFALCVFFIVTKGIVSDMRGLKEVLPFFDLVAIAAVFSCFNCIYRYIKLKDKKQLYYGIIMIPSIVWAMYKYFITL